MGLPGQAGAWCQRCKVAMDPAVAYYTEQGEQICRDCNLKAEIARDEGRSLATIKSAGYGSLPLAITSVVFNPFFLLTISSVAGALTALRGAKDDISRRKLGGEYWVLVVVCALAIIIAALGVTGVLRAILFTKSAAVEDGSDY